MAARFNASRVALSVALLLAGCEVERSPDLILVTLDTVRADHLGAYGSATAKTPNLDRMAAQGTVFERAYSSSALTLPSHATILTGLEPPGHGVRDNGLFVLSSDVPTLATALHDYGYETGGFVSALVLDRMFGLSRGFDVFGDTIASSTNPLTFTVPSRRGEEVTREAAEWLQSLGQRPFFLWVHYYDAHLPHAPPPPFDRFEAPYDGEIAYVDAQVGRLLEAVDKLRRRRPLLVVCVADHGEGLGQHDELTHGILGYDSTLRVPLIVSGPGFTSGRRERGLARTVDVAPTFLRAAGAPCCSPRSEGMALQDPLTTERSGYFESLGPLYNMGWAPMLGVRTTRWKYTGRPEPAELYDLDSDPDETRNVLTSEPAVAARLRNLFDTKVEQKEFDEVDRSTESMLPPDTLERLAALGYVHAPVKFEPDQRPDPREAITAMTWVERARSLAVQGKVADAIRALEILASSPISRPLALRSLAPILHLSGRFREAAARYAELADKTSLEEARLAEARSWLAAGEPGEAQRSLDILPSQRLLEKPGVAYVRAEVHLATGHTSDALRIANARLAQQPSDDTAIVLRVRALHQEDQEFDRIAALKKATQLFRKSEGRQTRLLLADLLFESGASHDALTQLEPLRALPEARVLAATIHDASGDLSRAISEVEEAIKSRPDQAYREFLADLYQRKGEIPAAIKTYDTMIAVDPGRADVLLNRGALHFTLGRLERAAADYSAALEIDATLAEAHVNLALVALRTGNRSRAARDLQHALKLQPNYSKAQRLMQELATDDD